jgi:integrase/recombinase XerD
VTHLRRMMLEEFQRRNYSQTTVRAYLLAVRQFAEYFHQPPDQPGPDPTRRFQSYLLQERKLSPRSVVRRVSALRFLLVKTLKRHYILEHIPFPKTVLGCPSC